ncbi:MAG TPA: DUF1127 domain-containing protein [Vineibacter sp.]|nr:DUF1127 domain-containing protein [Vineibacter sp.]
MSLIDRQLAIPHPHVESLLAPWRRALSARLSCAAIWTAIDRGRQRRALADLDHRMLDDIGVTRAEALRESAKPFWKR